MKTDYEKYLQLNHSLFKLYNQMIFSGNFSYLLNSVIKNKNILYKTYS